MNLEDFKKGVVFEDRAKHICKVIKKTKYIVEFVDGSYEHEVCFYDCSLTDSKARMFDCKLSKKKMPEKPASLKVGCFDIIRNDTGFWSDAIEDDFTDQQAEKIALWILDQLDWEISR